MVRRSRQVNARASHRAQRPRQTVSEALCGLAHRGFFPGANLDVAFEVTVWVDGFANIASGD